MPQSSDLADPKRLLDSGAQPVEVLPPAEYPEEHLPVRSTARTRSSTPTVKPLDRRKPVAVYCHAARVGADRQREAMP